MPETTKTYADRLTNLLPFSLFLRELFILLLSTQLHNPVPGLFREQVRYKPLFLPGQPLLPNVPIILPKDRRSSEHHIFSKIGSIAIIRQRNNVTDPFGGAEAALGEWQVFRDSQHYRIGLVCSQLIELAYGSSAYTCIQTGKMFRIRYLPLPSFNV